MTFYLLYSPNPAAFSINLTKLPPDGLNLSFPSFLSTFVPIKTAPFSLIYLEARQIFEKFKLKSVPTTTQITDLSICKLLNYSNEQDWSEFQSSISGFIILISKFYNSSLNPCSPITKIYGFYISLKFGITLSRI